MHMLHPMHCNKIKRGGGGGLTRVIKETYGQLWLFRDELIGQLRWKSKNRWNEWKFCNYEEVFLHFVFVFIGRFGFGSICIHYSYRDRGNFQKEKSKNEIKERKLKNENSLIRLKCSHANPTQSIEFISALWLWCVYYMKFWAKNICY